jgi:UDP-N-acetylglucosamine--N-acetylmuramyl-(pentapeptide) pyrophosphoryl-undecaprenol N-acetylglucosamine transferase
MRIVVTGGGTGGHISPALAVAEAVLRREPGAQVRYFGSRSGPEAALASEAGLEFVGVTSRKLRRLVHPSTVAVVFALLRGYREASAAMRAFDPQAVVSTGGYVAAATAIAAARQGRPTVIQAQDAVPGRTNLRLARWATRICIWYEETASAFDPARVVQTGVPLRSSILRRVGVSNARRTLGLAPDRFTLLAVGGSQGAQRLNEIVLEAAAEILGGASPVQVLHQVGARNVERLTADAARLLVPGAADAVVELGRRGYHLRGYLGPDEMAAAYESADVVVCRCGISTLAEVSAWGIPALMVPLPTAYADHQTANARGLERRGGGVLLPQSELTGSRLAEEVRALQRDDGRRAAMAEASRQAGRPDAADRVAEISLGLAAGR